MCESTERVVEIPEFSSLSVSTLFQYSKKYISIINTFHKNKFGFKGFFTNFDDLDKVKIALKNFIQTFIVLETSKIITIDV